MITLAVGLLMTQITFADVARDAVHKAAQDTGVPELLLLGVCKTESSLRPKAVHKNDGDGTPSVGLCQVKVETARWLGFKATEAKLLNPYYNARVSARYLLRLLKKYSYHADEAIAAYNVGHVVRNRRGHFVNQRYVSKVLNEATHARSR